MSTINSVGNGLAGTTGTGNFVGANTPTLITPVLGVATGTSINFGASATLGLIGVTGATNAASGYVGEYITNSASGVSLTNTNATNITSISLTAGDWNVFGYALIGTNGVTTNVFGTTTLNSATLDGNYTQIGLGSSGANNGFAIATNRVSISGTTTVYLVGRADFSTGTASGGGTISARRVR